MVTISPTLAANEKIRARQRAGHDVLHLAFGEAGLPVHPCLARVLRQASARNSYPSVAGDLAAREAVAGYFTRRDVSAHPDQVVVAPGSKALLYALLAVLPGDVVLPQPSWVSYAAQAALLGKDVVRIPVPAQAGGVPDPVRLDTTLARLRHHGRRPGILVLTVPDNPTGTVADERLLRQVCAVADAHGLVVVADQIYADVSHPGTLPVSAATLLPGRTVLTTGLSKSLALGGWRIGVAVLPAGSEASSWRSSLLRLASEVWSALPGPMQDVAAYAFGEPDELVAHVGQSARLHAAVARAAHDVFVEAGATCREPRGGFYLYPDFTSVLAARTAEALAETLLEEHDVAVLPGTAFGDEPDRLTFRAATSLLYGRTDEERWTALRAPDPVALPWISAALDRLRSAMARLDRT
jgi:aspartate aminotransferase